MGDALTACPTGLGAEAPPNGWGFEVEPSLLPPPPSDETGLVCVCGVAPESAFGTGFASEFELALVCGIGGFEAADIWAVVPEVVGASALGGELSPVPLALDGLGSELGLDGAALGVAAVVALAVAAGPVSTLELDADD